MKQLFKKRMAQVMAVLLAISMITCFIPQTAAQAYAESGDPGLELDTGVLETGVNTDSAQTVYYGVNGENPVAWRVIKYKDKGNTYIENQDGAMTLFAADNLTSGVQFATNGQNYYATSNLKVVLDGNDDVVGMYKSLFSTQEQSAIESRTLGVAGYTDVEPYSTGISGNQTSGYLWPLSTAEAFTLPSVIRSASSYWWLRSPGDIDIRAAIVYSAGFVHNDGIDVDDRICVRPAFNLDLSSVIFTSAAKGGKSSVSVGADALKPVSANTTGEWKLTVHDGSRDVFVASATTGAVLSAEEGYASWSVPIAYNLQYAPVSPTFADNEYVSVILADSSGNALYYGNIDKGNLIGTKNVTIPTGLAAGKFSLHVFSQEINDDYLTDYSSVFRTIELTVTAAPTYSVTVNNGDGGGEYTEGTTVTITADAPAEGKRFKEWTGDVDKVTFTEGSKKTATAEFTMPAKPLTFEATYENIPAKAAVPTGKTLTYNGKVQTGVAAGTGYTLSGTKSATKAGSYQATATLKSGYIWTDGTTAAKTINWKINKATNTFKIKARTATVKFSAVKNKNQKLGVTKVIKFTNKGQGAKTYVKKSGNKKITIAKKTGKVTVKKGLKRGTYKVKVKVKAAGNANYKASSWKAVTFTVKVR